MKGISMLLSVALLLAAHLLARHLKKSGTRPGDLQVQQLSQGKAVGSKLPPAPVPVQI
jgi:hypothetical protein